MILNRKGFSIVQMLMAAAILSILVAAFADLIIGMQKEVGRMKSKQNRVMTNYVLDQGITSQIGMASSAQLLPENEKLKACIEGGATSTCASNCCEGETEFEFYMLDSRDSTVDPKDRLKLGGTTNDPVFYNLQGENTCVQPNCFYRVISKFKARCPGGVSTCSHAESVKTSVSIIPEPGKEHLMKSEVRNRVYFVNINYKPFIVPIANQALTVGGDSTFSVFGNAGHPSEVQNYLFEKCQSADTTIATITCYGFMNGVGTIKISGVAIGTTKMTLQVNDGGLENNFSDDLEFNVTVSP